MSKKDSRSNGQEDRRATPERGSTDWTRREFLRTGGIVGALGGVGGPLAFETAHAATAPSPSPGIRRRVTLGQTGIELPDISFGTFSLESDESLIHHALDRGITHFDSAYGYTDGRAETVLGNALRGRRDQVTLTSKHWSLPTETVDQQMAILEKSLRRLQTDHVDLYLNHAVNQVDRLASEDWQRFAEKAKQQGKVRAIGMSGHAGRLGECLKYALDEQLVDAILVAYSFSQTPSFKQRLKQSLYEWLADFDIVAAQPRLPGLLERAHRDGVGVMVMKTLDGARLNDMRPFESPGRTFAQAAFRWVLSDPAVDGLVVSMTSHEMIDEYVEASGSGSPDDVDLALLARYNHRQRGTRCQIGCDACLDRCPEGVPIPDLMRFRMYDVDYGQPEVARREYAALSPNASACLTCSGTPCAGSCPSGLPIAELNRDTVSRLASDETV